jgi:hypothetical protein
MYESANFLRLATQWKNCFLANILAKKPTKFSPHLTWLLG